MTIKPKDYFALIADSNNYIPTPHTRYTLNKNHRPTAREEAIAHSVLQQANPRENISGSHPWGPEEKWVHQRLWIHETLDPQWRDIPIFDSHLYTIETTPDGSKLPVPNAIKQPAAVPMDLQAKIREALGEPLGEPRPEDSQPEDSRPEEGEFH